MAELRTASYPVLWQHYDCQTIPERMVCNDIHAAKLWACLQQYHIHFIAEAGPLMKALSRLDSKT